MYVILAGIRANAPTSPGFERKFREKLRIIVLLSPNELKVLAEFTDPAIQIKEE